MRFFTSRDPSRQQFDPIREIGVERLEPRIVLDGASSLGAVSGSPWQNPLDPLDTNNDGVLAPNDVIEVLSLTNHRGAGKLADWSAPPTLHRYAHDVATVFADSNGDGFLSAVDALQIVNRLNKSDPAHNLTTLDTRDDFPDFVDAAIRSLDLRDGYDRVRTAFEVEGDVDFVQLIPKYDRLAITGFVDKVAGGLSIQILDGDLEVIKSSADLVPREGVLASGWSADIAEITLPVQAGAPYYLRVQAEDLVSLGNYAVSVVNFDAGWWVPMPDSEAEQDLHGDTPGSDATNLPLKSGIASVSSFLDQADDADVFRIDVPEGVLEVSAEKLGIAEAASRAMTVKLYAHDGSLLTTALSQQAEVLTQSLPPGTYFVSVSREGAVGVPTAEGEAAGRAWHYRLDVRHHRPRCGPQLDSELGDDLHADESGDAATEVEFDDRGVLCLSSFLDDAEDVDVFRFTAATNRMRVGAGSVGSPYDVKVRVVDELGVVLAPLTRPGLRSGPGSRVYSLQEGAAYYLLVESVQPTALQYVMRAKALPHFEEIELTPPERSPGRPTVACSPQPVALDPALHGNDAEVDEIGPDAIPLEFDDRGHACIRSVLGRGSDQDVYQFTATELNLSVAVHGRGVKIRAYDAQGNELTNLIDRPSRPGAMRLETSLVVGELYFLVISSPSDLPQHYSLDAHQYYLGIDPIWDIDPI
ncbi:MAG: hypothetical protein CMJ75_09500 [Planctomycetaceae bacterium]|nr:hypothetical protein [Planctomycetaceae bacterium]